MFGVQWRVAWGFWEGSTDSNYSLTAVPQTEDKSPRKYRIIEDGTKRHGNLFVVWPIVPPDAVHGPLFMGENGNYNVSLNWEAIYKQIPQ